MLFVLGLWTLLRALLFGSVAIALENLALRHQLGVLQRSVPRPRLSRWDRILWVWLSRVWVGWRSSLAIVQPATVLAWHRRGFQRLGGQAERGQDPPHRMGFGHRARNPPRAAAAGTNQDLDREHAAQQRGPREPAQPRWQFRCPPCVTRGRRRHDRRAT